MMKTKGLGIGDFIRTCDEWQVKGKEVQFDQPPKSSRLGSMKDIYLI